MNHRIGLIGHPVSHSKSPQIFADFFQEKPHEQWEYSLWDLEEISQFQAIASLPNFIGCNVTLPHKASVISYLDWISEDANQIQAVNTVIKVPNSPQSVNTLTRELRNILSPAIVSRNTIEKDYLLIGFNTDIHGFQTTLNALPQPTKQAVILGNGGSSQAVKLCLRTANIPFTQYSRTPDALKEVFSIDDLSKRQALANTLWINTTPVGMHPHTSEMPSVDAHSIHPADTLIDLIYNPEITRLMNFFQSRGATTINGWTMLQSQAKQAWNLFKIAALVQ